ncbi:MAG: serine hydrolase domain-containing protein [Cyanobacteria bacterium J06638_22]
MLQAVEQRIEQVIHNLQSATAFEGELSPPKTLYEQLARYHTPGLSIAVIQDFAIDWARGFGVAEAGTSHDVTPDTLFQAGSIRKPIFALAVMRLVQEGRLSLDEDVNTYLTSWHVPANGEWQPRITLRHLLSHTAGTTAQGYYGYDASATLPTTLQVLKGEFPANSEKVEVNILPGLHYRYSGGGMVVGQQVLVDLLQKPFPDIMRELVFEPLGSERRLFQVANVLAVLAGMSVACFCWFHAGWLSKGLASIVSSITWSLLAPVQYSAVTPYGLTSSDWDQIVSGSSLTLGILSFIGMALLLRQQNNPSVLKGLSLYGGFGFVAIAFYLFAFALLGLGYAD